MKRRVGGMEGKMERSLEKKATCLYLDLKPARAPRSNYQLCPTRALY